MNIRFSEAIRLGSMLGKQVFYNLLGSEGASCAAGAALRASGLDAEPISWSAIVQRFPIVTHSTPHPLGSQISPIVVCYPDGTEKQIHDTLWCVVVDLNNTHRWTRERIADWVESIELQQEALQASASLENVAVTSQSS